MSGQRSIERSVLKAQYERFRAAWRNEKRFQQFTLDQGESLPKGMNQLGRAPTFKMWKEALEAGQIYRRDQEAPLADKSIPVESASWDDEGSL